MKKFFKLFLIMAMTFCYQTAFAQVQTYFVSDELTGDATAKDFVNAIEVDAWSFSGGLDSKDNVCFPGINIVKEVDSATPDIISSSVNASVFPLKGTLVQVQTNSRDGLLEPVLKIELNNYFVSSYALSSAARSTPVQESLIFSFEQAELTYYKRDAATGNVIGEIITQLTSGKCK